MKKFTEDFGRIVAKLNDDMSREYRGLDINFEKSLLAANHYTDALKGILISDDCRNKRLHLKNKNIQARYKYIEKKPEHEKFQMLREKLMAGRSTTIGLCGRKAKLGRYDDLFFMEKWGTSKEEHERDVKESKCGGHAVVVNGMRFKDGRCQINIRNSWGSGSGLEGWEDAENILKFTQTLEYLEENK